MKQKIEFDASIQVSYPLWRCPECGSKFYGGGPAVHKTGCNQRNYSKCICIIGPKAVERIKAAQEHIDENSPESLTGISLADLKEQLPHLL